MQENYIKVTEKKDVWKNIDKGYFVWIYATQ